ncbi:MAG: DUF5691 domain-containing protein [Aestuariibaculum sp.]
MRAKEHIKEITLLGTEKRTVNPELLPEAIQRSLHKVTIEDEADKALTTLVLYYFYNQGGIIAKRLDKTINITPIQEQNPYVNNAMVQALQRLFIVENIMAQDTLLQIWIAKAITENTIITPALCVPYFKAISKFSLAFKKQAKSTFGLRGEWLIEQDDNFKNLRFTENEETDIWAFGKKDQRESFIVGLLETNPMKALTIIENAWNNENARDKLWILKLLKQHINNGYKPFLETLYNQTFAYKEKETKTDRASRELVAGCLLLLENSELHKHTMAQFKTYLVKSKGGLLSKVFDHNAPLFQIPENPDNFFTNSNMLKSYGINAHETEAANFKTNQLYCFSKLVASIPFKAWIQLLQTDYKKTVSFLLTNQQFIRTLKGTPEPILLEALIELATSTKDTNTISSILPHCKNYDQIKRLLTLLSPTNWESVLLQNKDWLASSDILTTCPFGKREQWSLGFSEAVLESIKKNLDKNNAVYDYHLAKPCIQFLNTKALNVLVSINGKIEVQTTKYNSWQKHIYQPLSEGLLIRQQIEQA